MQILIFGMHRAGTSITTRLINMMGVYFGPEESVGPISNDNPKGFWERPEVCALNNKILEAQGCTWSDVAKWRPEQAERIPEDTKFKLKKFILGMDAHRPWVLKDPRMCLVFPAWQRYLEVPIAVIVHRKPVEIAISLQKRDGFSLEYGIALWEQYAINMLNNTQQLPRIFIRHGHILNHPAQSVQVLFDQFVSHGVRRIAMPSEKEIRAFIDPLLYRSKPEADHNVTLSEHQKMLVEILRGERAQNGTLRISEQSQQILSKKVAS